MTNLSERITEAIKESGVRVEAISTACGISDQAVYAWMSGETKKISGENLVEVSAITGYEARWIAKGIGPKQRFYAKTNQQAHVLKVMQEKPEVYSNMLVKIADTVAEQPPNKDNGEQAKAA